MGNSFIKQRCKSNHSFFIKLKIGAIGLMLFIVMLAKASDARKHQPYITQEVMIEAIENPVGLTDGMLLEVINANPDLCKDEAFREKVLFLRPNLPFWTEEMLLENATEITAKTELEIKEAAARAEKEFAAATLAKDALYVDEVSEKDVDALRQAFLKAENERGDLELAKSYAEKGELAEAELVLDNAEWKYAPESVAAESEATRELIRIMELFCKEDQPIESIGAGKLAQLKNFVDDKELHLAMQARNILNFVGEGRYIDHPLLPEGGSAKREITSKKIKERTENLITIKPNPAKTFFELQFALLQAQQLTIEVADISSKIVYKESFDALLGSKLIETKDWQNGTYMVHVSSDSGVRYIEKLIIAK